MRYRLRNNLILTRRSVVGRVDQIGSIYRATIRPIGSEQRLRLPANATVFAAEGRTAAEAFHECCARAFGCSSHAELRRRNSQIRAENRARRIAAGFIPRPRRRRRFAFAPAFPSRPRDFGPPCTDVKD